MLANICILCDSPPIICRRKTLQFSNLSRRQSHIQRSTEQRGQENKDRVNWHCPAGAAWRQASGRCKATGHSCRGCECYCCWLILHSIVRIFFLVIIITTFTSAFTTYCDLRHSEQPFWQPQVLEQDSRRGSRCKNRLATELYISLVLPRTYLFGFGSARRGSHNQPISQAVKARVLHLLALIVCEVIKQARLSWSNPQVLACLGSRDSKRSESPDF